MKHLLSLILLTILLTTAIYSCGSSKQSSVEYTDTTAVSVTGTAAMLSNDEILSFINASRELAVSGIKIEFFPPDSVHPNSRAAPKSLTIDNVTVKESTEEATHATTAVDEQKTVNLSAQSFSALQQNSSSENEILRPSCSSVFLWIACALILLMLIYLLKK